MRLFCKCGCQLVIKHEIVLKVVSNFTHVGKRITITKHHLERTEGISRSFKEKDVKGIYCRECDKLKDLEDAYIKCDNCGNHIPRDDSKRYGDTIILCARCVNSCKSFDIFKLFGNRGPTPQTRDTRVDDAINEAREARPEIPNEIFEILEGEELEASNPDRPFEVPEEPRINAVPQTFTEWRTDTSRWIGATDSTSGTTGE